MKYGVWERLFTDNFRIRKHMFKSLVEPAFLYGCEVTGFCERIQRKHFKWIMGLGMHTTNAMLMDELKLYPVVDVTRKKAMQFEERAAKSPCTLLRDCIRLVHEGEVNQFTESRRLYCERGGQSGNRLCLR